jgi:hypothetical protein
MNVLLNFSFQSNQHCVTLIDEEYGKYYYHDHTAVILLLQLLMQSEGQTLSKLHQFGTSVTVLVLVKNFPGMYMLMKRYSAYRVHALTNCSDNIFILQVRKSSTSKYISIEDKHGKVVDSINVLSDDVQILGKKLTFSTNFRWNDSKDYVMVFEQGVWCVHG